MTKDQIERAGAGEQRELRRQFWRRLRRKFLANDLIGDLRLVQLEYWPEYRRYFERGTVGHCLGALLHAERHGRLRSQRPRSTFRNSQVKGI